MLIFIRRLDTPIVSDEPLPLLVLDHEQRRRTRQRTTRSDGVGVGIALPRGTVLRPGDILATEDDQRAQVRAAFELLSIAATADPFILARAAYHLGNRHTALQLGAGYLCYPHAPVLDLLCVRLGLAVSFEHRAFEPELLGHSAHDNSPEWHLSGGHQVATSTDPANRD